VGNKKDYLIRLQLAVEHLHNCSAHHVRTDHVHETFKGQTVWNGDVEVFSLTGHPKAHWCYGWSHRDGKDDQGERFVAVLEIPPVEDAKTAVRVQIVKDVKSGYSK
jgi:hypothetical protein